MLFRKNGGIWHLTPKFPKKVSDIVRDKNIKGVKV